jgi:hypothetical protein
MADVANDVRANIKEQIAGPRKKMAKISKFVAARTSDAMDDAEEAFEDTRGRATQVARHVRHQAQVTPTVRERDGGIAPELTGVSETMLWSLHNRASEARRFDGVLIDPDSVRIHEAIDYDFTRRFGDPLGFLAARAAEIDRVLRSWLERHPDGCVVSLGEGLETQSRRVDNGRMTWLSVDLPDAIRLRERFLAPTHRFRPSPQARSTLSGWTPSTPGPMSSSSPRDC